MTDITLTITGMGCEGCKKTVTEALNKVEGVQAINVDLNSGTAAVTYAAPATADDLVAIVQKAGYIAAPA
jgi:copper chaperone CopZ